MTNKEATARIKINKLLEAAGWRFFPEGEKPANIRLETTVKLKPADLDALGEDFEKTGKGFVDFLLLDDKAVPVEYRQRIQEYVKDYVSLIQFAA